jgi:N-methylhydantoinase A
LCAWGALSAPLGREYSLTVRESEPQLHRLETRARPMIARARAELVKDGARDAAIRNELWVDMRYRGQSYELEVKLDARFVEKFHDAHRRMFGHSAAMAAVEVVNLRLRAYAPGPSIAPQRLKAGSKPAPLSRTRVLVGNSYRPVPVFERDALGAGTRIQGPMLVVELSATAYVSPEFTLQCDDYGNLHLEAR